MLIDGLHVPLSVPFSRDGRLYLHKLETNVRRYSLSPAAGLIALAPNSESGSLSDAETGDLLDAVGQAAAREKVLLAGISRNSVAQALTTATLAFRAGFDALAVAAPPRWPEMLRHAGSAAELLSFFRTVADNAPLPVFLWSDTATPWLGISAETVGVLAEHRNILGIYDANLTPERVSALIEQTRGKQIQATVTTTFRPVTRRMARQGNSDGLVSAEALGRGKAASAVAADAVPSAAASVKTRTRQIGFHIMSTGPASELPQLLGAGAHGFAPTLAAPAPQSCHEVLAAFGDGEPALAVARAARLREADLVLEALGPAAVCHACDLNGYFGGTPRLPVAPLTAEGRQRVEAAMADLHA